VIHPLALFRSRLVCPPIAFRSCVTCSLALFLSRLAPSPLSFPSVRDLRSRAFFLFATRFHAFGFIFLFSSPSAFRQEGEILPSPRGEKGKKRTGRTIRFFIFSPPPRWEGKREGDEQASTVMRSKRAKRRRLGEKAIADPMTCMGRHDERTELVDRTVV
jgi:hypothetical protein